MTEEPVEWPKDVAELVDAEKQRPGPSPAARARMQARLLDNLAAPPAAGSEPAASGGPPLDAATSALRSKLVIAAVSFVLGGAVATALHRPLPTPAPRQPIQQVEVAAIDPVQPPHAPIVIDDVPTKKVVERPRPPKPLTKDERLAAERAIVERARTALVRGQAADAVGELGRHAADFPDGLLAEDREALLVQALAAAGRRADAQLRAERFRARYPSSLYLPLVDAVTAASGAPE